MLMSWIRRVRPLKPVLAGLTLATAAVAWAPAANAGPALYWWHMPLSMDMTECGNRAEGVMTAVGIGNVSREGYRIFAYNNAVTAVIKCLNPGGETMAVMIVTSNNADQAQGLLYDMRTHSRWGA